MSKLSRLSAQQRDDLVAYLDGELDEQSTQQIEQVLASNNVARHDVDMLARTWDLLNVLPTPRASAEFTQRTMTQIETQPMAVPLSTRPWFRIARQSGILTVWALGLALVGWLAFSVARGVLSTEADLLVDDLPVIQNFQRYQEVDADPEFLRKLQENRKLSHADAAE